MFVCSSVCWSIRFSPLALRLKSQSQGSNPSLEARIPAARPNLSLKAQISSLRLKSQPGGSCPSIEAQIPAWRLKSQVQIPALRPNPSLRAEISAPRLQSLPYKSNLGEVTLSSTGHRPLQGCCPKKLGALFGRGGALNGKIWLAYKDDASFSHKKHQFWKTVTPKRIELETST